MFRKILGFFYPETCIFCGKICPGGICADCRAKVLLIREPRCKRCGKPVRYAEEELCYDCSHRKFHYEQGRSLWLHKAPVSQSVYDFKYKNRRVYGEVYAREFVRAFGKLIRIWEIDLIVPVPLHRKKFKKRGYNQAEIVAREIGARMGIAVDSALVIRKRDTAPQKRYGHTERRKNLADAFAVSRTEISARHILIIDDIYTTGSTVDSVAKVLRQSGAEKTYFLTISIGQGL